MANGAHYCAFNFNNQAEAFFFPGDSCVRINYVRDFIIGKLKKITESFPSLINTDFAAGIDAAFTNSKENEVYIFKGKKYILLNFVSHENIGGPNEITDGFPYLKGTVFDKGIDAAFASSQDNEAYIFKDDQYAVINHAAATETDFWVTKPRQIIDGFRYFGPTDFMKGLGTAFSANTANEAYIFKDDTYARINYNPTTTSFIIGPVTPIKDGFHCLSGIIPPK